MSTPETLSTFVQILRSLTPPTGLPDRDHLSLLMKGAIVTLEQDGSPEAVSILEESAVTSPAPDARDLCRTVLYRMAQAGNGEAVSALYRLAIERDDPAAVDLIRRSELTVVDRLHPVLFAFLFGSVDQYRALDSDFTQLTGAFLATNQPSLRDRLLKAAERHGMENWIWIVLALSEAAPGSHADLIERFRTFTAGERALAVNGLESAAEQGSGLAQNTISEICIHYEDPLACSLAIERGYAPLDTTRQALFFFLTEQWDDYDRVDFASNLISAAFENANPTLRQRILAQSRYTGRVEWLSASQSRRLRWLRDLSDADWQTSIRQLAGERRFEGLWKLAQVAPPFWSAAILEQLSASGWTPDDSIEPAVWQRLIHLARQASQSPLELAPKRSLHVSNLVTALAASPDGRLLAVGGPDPMIHLWKFPHGPWQTPLSGPVAQVRALDFSPAADTLVSAGGDHTLRVFRLSDGQLVKTFSGHSGLVRSLLIHPDGHTIFSASFDG
ncbi:MAG TPA: WD40 repeat domain-containing protein, partial [Anaerolineaceae bacterium]|nr:WD40 repeat domain-containing protein [Anaerolineaceae bacterium]